MEKRQPSRRLPDYVTEFVDALATRLPLLVLEVTTDLTLDRSYIVRGYDKTNKKKKDAGECFAVSFSRTENHDVVHHRRYVYLDRLRFPKKDRGGCTMKGTELLTAILAVCDHGPRKYHCMIEDAAALFVERQKDEVFVQMRHLYLLGTGRTWYGSYGFEIDPLYDKKEDMAFAPDLKKQKKRDESFTYDAINTQRIRQPLRDLGLSPAIDDSVKNYVKELQKACAHFGFNVPYQSVRPHDGPWTEDRYTAFRARYSLQSLAKAMNHFIVHVPATVKGSPGRKLLQAVVNAFETMSDLLTATETPVLYLAVHYIRYPHRAGGRVVDEWKDENYTISDRSERSERSRRSRRSRRSDAASPSVISISSSSSTSSTITKASHTRKRKAFFIDKTPDPPFGKLKDLLMRKKERMR
jgi:hypothetical protein